MRHAVPIFGRRSHHPPLRHRVAPSVGAHSSNDCAAPSLLQHLCSSSEPLVRRFGMPGSGGPDRASNRFSGAFRANLPIGRNSRNSTRCPQSGR
ncbi:hypothetical protein C6P75_09735 [Burkholderia multivorans]|nr:hypothetical protein C6P75_09735 [Burkholderia multivorans]